VLLYLIAVFFIQNTYGEHFDVDDCVMWVVTVLVVLSKSSVLQVGHVVVQLTKRCYVIVIYLQLLTVSRNCWIVFLRKFADIGQTVAAQYRGGLLSINDWCDFVTVHSLPGPGVISALRQVANCHSLANRHSCSASRTNAIDPLDASYDSYPLIIHLMD